MAAALNGSRGMVRKSAKTDGQKSAEIDSPKSSKTSEKMQKRLKTSEKRRKGAKTIVVLCSFLGRFPGALVAQCSATPATVAATPPCSATPFQTQISVRHLSAQGGGGATPKFLGV